MVASAIRAPTGIDIGVRALATHPAEEHQEGRRRPRDISPSPWRVTFRPGEYVHADPMADGVPF